ncbi:hypothetical protein [Glycomyces tarimensis]
MTEPERPSGIYRQEALDNYARMDRHDTAPSFNPAAMLPRWWAVAAGMISLVLLGVGGLWHQVDQGPRGMVVDVADDSVIVAFSDTPPNLVGEAVVLALGDGTELEGTASDSEQVTGNGATGTMLLVDLETFGAATGYEGETVTVNSGSASLLTDIFSDRGEGRA